MKRRSAFHRLLCSFFFVVVVVGGSVVVGWLVVGVRSFAAIKLTTASLHELEEYAMNNDETRPAERSSQ